MTTKGSCRTCALDKTQRDDGTLSSSEFAWTEQANEYRAQGQALRSEWRMFKRPRTPRRTGGWRSTSIGSSKAPRPAIFQLNSLRRSMLVINLKTAKALGLDHPAVSAAARG